MCPNPFLSPPPGPQHAEDDRGGPASPPAAQGEWGPPLPSRQPPAVHNFLVSCFSSARDGERGLGWRGGTALGGHNLGGGGGAQPGGPTCRVLEAGGLLRWVTPATAGCVWGSGRVGWGGADTWAPVSGGKGLPWVGRGPVYGGGAFGGLGAAGTAGRGSSSRRRRAATAHLLFSCVSGVGPKRRPGGPPRTLGPPPPPPGVHVHREEGATVAAGTGEPAVSMATGLRFAGKKR